MHCLTFSRFLRVRAVLPVKAIKALKGNAVYVYAVVTSVEWSYQCRTPAAVNSVRILPVEYSAGWGPGPVWWRGESVFPDEKWTPDCSACSSTTIPKISKSIFTYLCIRKQLFWHYARSPCTWLNTTQICQDCQYPCVDWDRECREYKSEALPTEPNCTTSINTNLWVLLVDGM